MVLTSDSAKRLGGAGKKFLPQWLCLPQATNFKTMRKLEKKL